MVKNWASEASEKISWGVWSEAAVTPLSPNPPSNVVGGKAPEYFYDHMFSTFNLRLFPTSLGGLKKDHFCTDKDNGTWHFYTQDENFSF